MYSYTYRAAKLIFGHNINTFYTVTFTKQRAIHFGSTYGNLQVLSVAVKTKQMPIPKLYELTVEKD